MVTRAKGWVPPPEVFPEGWLCLSCGQPISYGNKAHRGKCTEKLVAKLRIVKRDKRYKDQLCKSLQAIREVGSRMRRAHEGRDEVPDQEEFPQSSQE
jgi:hypothetical protein